jgi:hypothetical protein
MRKNRSAWGHPETNHGAVNSMNQASTGCAAASGDACGGLPVQQVGAGIGDRESPSEPFSHRLVDVVEPGPLVPLAAGTRGRAGSALYCLDAGQRSAGRRYPQLAKGIRVGRQLTGPQGLSSGSCGARDALID